MTLLHPGFPVMLPAAALVAAAFPLLRSMLLLLAQFCKYQYDNTVVLQIWTLPGLEPVKVFSLPSCLGFPWSWQSEPSLLTNLHHMCCLAPDGHMALVGPCNEVITLGVLRGLHPPAPLGGLYDQDLSEAAIAAAGAIADLHEKQEPWSGVTPHDAAATTAGKTFVCRQCCCQHHNLCCLQSIPVVLLENRNLVRLYFNLLAF